MNDFWKDREEIERMLLILSIIVVVTTYGDSLYNKIQCRISVLFREKFFKSLIQQQHLWRIQEVFRIPLYTILLIQI